MADAYRDGNDVPTLIACSSSDGQTPVRLYADPTSHRLLVGTNYATVDTAWVTSGNTMTVTDTNATTTSLIVFMATGTVPPVGNWAVARSNGSFIIKSSDSESAGLTFSYKILP